MPEVLVEDVFVLGWKCYAAKRGAGAVPFQTELLLFHRVVLATRPSELCGSQVKPCELRKVGQYGR